MRLGSECLPLVARSEAKHAVVEFIEVDYSRKRPHSTIGYQIPAKAMDEFFERTRPRSGEPMLAGDIDHVGRLHAAG